MTKNNEDLYRQECANFNTFVPLPDQLPSSLYVCSNLDFKTCSRRDKTKPVVPHTFKGQSVYLAYEAAGNEIRGWSKQYNSRLNIRLAIVQHIAVKHKCDLTAEHGNPNTKPSSWNIVFLDKLSVAHVINKLSVFY
jgi:hypothetical protein